MKKYVVNIKALNSFLKNTGSVEQVLTESTEEGVELTLPQVTLLQSSLKHARNIREYHELPADISVAPDTVKTVTDLQQWVATIIAPYELTMISDNVASKVKKALAQGERALEELADDVVNALKKFRKAF